MTNIPPGHSVTVEIGYQHRADYRFDERTGPELSLRFPMTIMPRFMPGAPLASLVGSGGTTQSGKGWAFDTAEVPDASRISPFIADPAAGPVNPVALTVNLDPGFPLGDVTSSYHVAHTVADEDAYRITLADGVVPSDRDFELIWTPAAGTTPHAGLFSEMREAMAHHAILLTPPVVMSDASETPPREVIFILDRSSSMSGQPILQAKAALGLALDRLQPSDRFNILAFSSETNPVFGDPVQASRQNITFAKAALDRIDASGGTHMAPAIEAALRMRGHDFSGLTQVVFITDGAVGNEAALMRLISRELGDSRLFTVGIGAAPNGYFMREAAAAGRGTFTLIGSADQVTGRMDTLFRQLEAPVLTDLSLRFEDQSDGTASVTQIEVFPPILPDLYAGQPVEVVARVPAAFTGRAILEGNGPDGLWQRRIDVGGTDDRSGHPGVAAIWGREKIAQIERDQHREAISQEQFRQAVLDVALPYELLSRFTSLIAIDPLVSRPQGEALAEALVDANIPEGATMTPPTRANAARASATANLPTLQPIHNPFQASQLPQTATPAELLALLSALLFSIGLLLLVIRHPREE